MSVPSTSVKGMYRLHIATNIRSGKQYVPVRDMWRLYSAARPGIVCRCAANWPPRSSALRAAASLPMGMWKDSCAFVPDGGTGHV